MDVRRTGIPAVGSVPWGTHICQVYETPADLLEVLVPYLQAGLEDGELCTWITSAPLDAVGVTSALRQVAADLDGRLADGQIEILHDSQWYAPAGRFDGRAVLDKWRAKVDAALTRGYVGVRVAGDAFWVGSDEWRALADYEAAANAAIGDNPMLALCTYSAARCGPAEIADAVSNHQFALIRRGGRWEAIRGEPHAGMQRALQTSEARFRLLAETAGRLLASDDPQAVVNDLCRKVAEHLDCQAFFNFLVDEAAGRLRLNTCAGIPPQEAARIEWLDYGVAVCGCVAKDGRRIVAEDIAARGDPRTELVRSYGMQAYACHPLLAGDKVIGTLSFGTRTRKRFSADDLSLMKTVADQVAVAMVRIRNEQALRKAREELEQRVRQRTADLAGTVEALQKEAARRLVAEQSLRDANELLETTFRNIHLAVAYMDTSFRFIRVNDAYAAAGRQEPEWFVGKRHFDLYPSAENEYVFQEVVRLGEAATFHEKPFEYPDQPERGVTYWDWTLQPVKDAAGAVAGLVLSLRDATERVRARQAVDAEHKRLSAVLNMFPGYVSLVDRGHRVRFANHGFVRAFGEPSGRPCHEVLYGRAAACEVCPIPGVVDGGQPSDWEWTAAGGRRYHVWAFPFSDVDGEPAMIEFGVDVTERRELEALVVGAAEGERRRLGRDLHDSLGQELTALRYLVEALAAGVADGAEARRDLAARCDEAAQKAISQLRAMSHGLDPVGLEADGLADALDRLAEDVTESSGIACRFRRGGRVELDETAATQLYRIAHEATSNAVKHARAKRIVLRLGAADGGVVMSVADDGVGLPAGAERAGGMGMRVMKYRANSVGARLVVEPRPGGGTIVRCSLPSREAHA